jgi:hypothetical protein
MAYLLENYLTDENVMASFYTLKEQIRSEVPRNNDRWGLNGDFGWEEHIASLEKFLTSGRIDQMKSSIADAMNIPLSDVQRYFGKRPKDEQRNVRYDYKYVIHARSAELLKHQLGRLCVRTSTRIRTASNFVRSVILMTTHIPFL